MEPNPNNLKRIADDFTVSPFVKPHSYSIPISNSIIKQTHHHKIYYLFTTHFHPIFWTYNVFGANVALWECPKVILKKKKKKKKPNKPFFLVCQRHKNYGGASLNQFEGDTTWCHNNHIKRMTTPLFLSSPLSVGLHPLLSYSSSLCNCPLLEEAMVCMECDNSFKTKLYIYIYIMTCMDRSGGTNFIFIFNFLF